MSELVAPVLLVAMPQVLDPFFHRAVVLLVHHAEDDGSFGLIVNRPTAIQVGDILRGMDLPWGGERETVAFFGGPVQPQLGTVLFNPPEGWVSEGATEVRPDLYMTQHIGDLASLAPAPPAQLRLLLGYAGWAAGQLVEEILRDDWMTAPVSAGLLFSDRPSKTWDRALASVGVDPASLPSWTTTAPETSN